MQKLTDQSTGPLNGEDQRISVLTAYVVGLEGVLARMVDDEAKNVFMTASDFAAGIVRLASDAIAHGALPAAQRVNSQPIQKHFREGWPSVVIPAAMDLIIWRDALLNWVMKNEHVLSAHFYGTSVAPQFTHHLEALYEGLGVIARHSGETRNIRPTRDDRARSAEQKFKFDFKMG